MPTPFRPDTAILDAKANPGKINFGTGGVGTSPHLSGELLKTMTGINLVHVPYRGTAPALSDLLAGQVQVVFDNIPGSIGHIRSGKVRALGVTGSKRVAAIPDVPTIGETVPGYEVSIWYGIAALLEDQSGDVAIRPRQAGDIAPCQRIEIEGDHHDGNEAAGAHHRL